MAGAVLLDNTTENLATWLFEKVLARKIITSHHSHPSCRGQRLFLMKDDVSFPLRTFQWLLIIFGIKSKLLNLAFAYSPGLTSYSSNLAFFPVLRHKPVPVTALDSLQWQQFSFSFARGGTFLPSHPLLNVTSSILTTQTVVASFLSHDPILLLWYFSYLSPYLSFPLEWKTEKSHSCLYSLLQGSARHIAGPQKNHGWLWRNCL